MVMRRALALSLLAGVLSMPLSVAAQSVYVLHGIQGADLGVDPALPVDISVNGACLAPLTDVRFTELIGPVPLAPGRYDIEVRLSNGSCTGALAVATTTFLGLGENATIVAHLTEQGTPTLTRFVNDVRPLGNGQARIAVRHAAAAPAVNVLVKQRLRYAYLDDLKNGAQEGAEVRAGDWSVAVYPKGSIHPVFGPTTLNFEAGKATFVYAVGSLKTGTFQPIVQVIDIP
jgi:hypothetical protein